MFRCFGILAGWGEMAQFFETYVQKKTLARYVFRKNRFMFCLLPNTSLFLLAGRPGTVTVTVTTKRGECLGETVFTYKDPEEKANNQGLCTKRKVEEASAILEEFLKKFKQIGQGDDGEESRKLAFQQGN